MTMRTQAAHTKLLAALAALALIATACGSSDEAATTTTTTEPTVTTDTSDPGTASTTTTTVPTTTTEPPASTTTGLPGDPFDGFISDGDVLAVMGVAYDDTLNVRAGPGADQQIVTTAIPTEDNLVATGRQRLLPGSIWYEVDLDGTTGWLNSSFVAYMGGTDDFTSAYIAEFGRSEAPTMDELGQLIADNIASEDPPSRIVRSVASSAGDVSEVTYDVIGLGDDATAGYRLHVFGVDEGSNGTFGLRTIERTTFCSRGLSGEFCV